MWIAVDSDPLGENQDVAPLGVYVAGSFNEWNPNATMLTMQEDQIYEISLELQPGEYEFKFINGNSWNDVEEVPYSCNLELLNS